MFDKLKEFSKLQEMQKKIKAETVEVEHNGVFVKINGAMDILELRLNHNNDAASQERTVKDCLNEAKDKMQKNLAHLMGGMM
jgi:DNA-binding protein YbaB